MVREEKLMFNIKSFISFNNKYVNNGYTSIYKPDIQEGFIPFDRKCFKLTDTNS